MKKYLLVSLLFLTSQAYASYSCAWIKSLNSCLIFTQCNYDYNVNTCQGSFENLPRYLDEFLKDTHHTFSVEQILASNEDLFELAKQRKKLTQFILRYKITDTTIFSNLDLLKIDFKTIDETLKKYSHVISSPNYPSISILLQNEEVLRNFSVEHKVTLLKLLNMDPKILMSVLEGPNIVNKLIELGLSIDDILELKTTKIFKMSESDLDRLMKIFQINDLKKITDENSFILNFLNDLERCVEQDKDFASWILKTNIYVNLQNILEISDLFKIPFSEFTVKKEDLIYLSNIDANSMRGFKDFNFDFKQILKEKFPSIRGAYYVKKLSENFNIPLSEAVFYNYEWTIYSKRKVISLAEELGQPVSYVLKMKPEQLSSDEVIHELKKLKFPETYLKFLPDAFDNNTPKQYKDILDYLVERIGSQNLKSYSFNGLLYGDASKKLEQFKEDWLKYQNYFNFVRFLEYWEPDLEVVRRKLFESLIINGDLNELKLYPVSEEELVSKSVKYELPIAVASELEYEDVFEFIKKLTPKTVRYTVVHGVRQSNECGISWDRGLNPFVPNPYYMKCNPDEPVPLLYKKEEAEFIESQGRFWNRVNWNGTRVQSNIGGYKGGYYEEIGRFTSINREKTFPFTMSNNKLVQEQVNRINYALLLVNKFNKETIVYRSQKCNTDWITNPYRLWSTTANAEFARKWRGACILEIQIPPGYPFLFLNIVSKSNNRESEFLLPAYVLNSKGKLVAASYEIVKEEKNKSFQSVEYDAVHDIEYQYAFSARSFLVKPASDLMTFKGKTEKEFAEYQKHYVDLVCSPENLKDPDDSLQYLREMCEQAKKVYPKQDSVPALRAWWWPWWWSE